MFARAFRDLKRNQTFFPTAEAGYPIISGEVCLGSSRQGQQQVIVV